MTTITPPREMTTQRKPSMAASALAEMARKLLFLIVFFAVCLVGLALARPYLPSLKSSEVAAIEFQTADVERGPLRISITENGDVESANNENVKSMVPGSVAILKIVKDGSLVKADDVLIELDSSDIKDKINLQQIAVEKAKATKVQAEEDEAVARISIDEYENGTYIQLLQTADANIVIARENLKNSQNMLEHSDRMFRKGYINQLQLESAQFGVERSKLELEAQQTSRKVLVDYSKAKMIKELKSKHEASHAKMLAEKSAFELELSKLEKLRDMEKNCTIKAPRDGMVIYANDRSRRSSGPMIEEGSMVRESQTLIWLPDLTKLQVRVRVHESKVDKLRPGMRGEIKVRDFKGLGTLVAIASQPEPSQFFASTVKEYACTVKLDENQDLKGLKPGMTSEVEIVIDDLQDTAYIPILGTIQHEGEHFVFLPRENSFEKRPIKVGPTNDTFICINEGLDKGEKIVLNPRAVVPEAKGLVDASLLDMSKAPAGSLKPVKVEGADSGKKPKKPVSGKGKPAPKPADNAAKTDAPKTSDGKAVDSKSPAAD